MAGPLIEAAAAVLVPPIPSMPTVAPLPKEVTVATFIMVLAASAAPLVSDHVGAGEGECVGDADGEVEGFELGDCEGDAEGIVEGDVLGDVLGLVLGPVDGLSEGDKLGLAVGEDEGEDVGASVLSQHARYSRLLCGQHMP